VNFTALEEHGAAHGLLPLGFQNLSRTLLDAGEPDRFASALAATDAREELALRLQLKSLLFGMGETFRTLTQRKA
jgi:SAM-dependent MidA family methyltransferase